jgi:5-methylcytosine-specific restriction endonuclease McrA
LVVVLNADYTFLSTTSWQSAICMIIEGKAETIKETEKLVRNYTKTVVLQVPVVIRLIKFVRRVFKNKVPFSKRNVFIRDKQTCAYCGEKIEIISNCTIDHIIPRAQGGKTTWTNCITACKPCNNKKADKKPSEAGMKLKFKATQPTITEFIQYFSEKYGIDKLLKEL